MMRRTHITISSHSYTVVVELVLHPFYNLVQDNTDCLQPSVGNVGLLYKADPHMCLYRVFYINENYMCN